MKAGKITGEAICKSLIVSFMLIATVFALLGLLSIPSFLIDKFYGTSLSGWVLIAAWTLIGSCLCAYAAWYVVDPIEKLADKLVRFFQT